MKKTKKALATLAIASMVMTSIPFNALADASATRIYGNDRIQTAINVAQTGWSTGASTVIVAPAADANLVDALAAAPLAGQDNAPILLTAGSALDANTKQEIMNLKATKVIAVGALSDQVISDLQGISGVSVQQLKGSDRIDTASKIAAQLTAPAGTFVVGYGALADALSVASYAAANKYEILVANPDGSLPSSEVPVGTKYVIGGPTLVNDGAVVGATRIAGTDRYDTNDQVIQKLGSKFDTVFVANGENAHLVDSLVASVYAAKSNSVIALTDNNTVQANDFLGTKMTASSNTVALGGTGVVSETVRSSVKSGGTTPPPSTNVAGISAVNMSNGGSVATGQALVTVGTITVNGGANGATISGISLTRTGLSADTTISSITVWNGTQRLNVPNILSSGSAAINFTNPLVLAANQSATLAVKVNISAGAVSGAQFAITVNSLQGATSTLLPATSGTMTVSNVALGTLTCAVSGDAPAVNSTLDAGSTNQRLAKFDFTANTEDQLLKQVTFTQNSSIGDTDLANLMLYNNGTQVGATATMSSRKVTFTFGDGILITSGSTVRLELRGDVIGGSGRDVQFDINDANDVQSVGKTYGSTIVGQNVAGHLLIVNPGNFIVSKDTSSAVAGTIATVVKGQAFTTVKVQAVGEPIQLQKINVKATPTGAGNAATKLTNLKLVSGGNVIGQVTTPLFAGAGNVETVTLSSPITVTPGTPVTISITADIPTGSAAVPGWTYTLGVANIPAGATALSGVGNVSGVTLNIATPGDVMGNIMTVGNIAVTATPVAMAATNLYMSSANNNLVSFDLTQNMNEDVSVSQLNLADSGVVGDLANMEIVDSTGNVISNVITTPSTTPSFTFNNPIVIKAGATVRITLKADVLSTATVGNVHAFSVVASPNTAHTVALGTDVATSAAASVTNFTVSNGGTQVAASVSANANLDAAIFVARGAKDVKVAAFKLNNSLVPLAEAASVQSIYLNPVYAGGLAAQDVSNIRIVDYKDNTKIYATVAQLPAGGKKIDLSTPITVSSDSASHSMDFVVLADISSTAPYAGQFGVTLGGAPAGTDDLKYQSAITGQTTDDHVTTVLSATTATVTESTINIVAANIPNPVTSSVGPGYAALAGNTIGQFTLTNNGSKSVLLDQVQLSDTMGTLVTATGATVQLVRTSTGVPLTAAPYAWVTGYNNITLGGVGGATLRLDPGASESISIRLVAPGSLAAGSAVALRLTKNDTPLVIGSGTLYEDLNLTGAYNVNDDATSAVVTFVHP